MFFKNLIKIPVYLEQRVKEMLTEDGIFRLENFFDEYQEMVSASGGDEASSESEKAAYTPPDRELFINRFIGTLLWLIKYRTLSTAKNKPAKLAFLDLRFDIVMPGIIDKFFQRYDTDTIKKSYDAMDVGCKKAFTGEMQKEKRPRFLISPIWAKNPVPPPFRVAARLFSDDFGREQNGENSKFESLLEERFMEFTQTAADSCKEINFWWIVNR